MATKLNDASYYHTKINALGGCMLGLPLRGFFIVTLYTNEA